jgi:hypothetical protein
MEIRSTINNIFLKIKNVKSTDIFFYVAILISITFYFFMNYGVNNTTEHIKYLQNEYKEVLIVVSNDEYMVITEKDNLYYCRVTIFDILLPCEKFENKKGIVFFHGDRRKNHYIQDLKNEIEEITKEGSNNTNGNK